MKVSSRMQLGMILGILVSAIVAGCGGGGSTADGSAATVDTGNAVPVILSWTPPESFADQTPLDPAKDLSHYEIHISSSTDFSGADVTEATVSALDPATGQLVTSFDLANLSPYLAPSATYYVSMRSVSNTGVKSDYSPSASFSL